MLILINLVELKYVWMIQFPKDGDLIDEILQVEFIAFFLLNNLHCSDITSQLMDNFFHFPKVTCANS